jgi:hypothetical protein
MKEESSKKNVKIINKYGHGGIGGGVYGLGLIGALVYYFQNSVVFMDYLVGFFKAVFWPAFLIYKVFNLLGM